MSVEEDRSLEGGQSLQFSVLEGMENDANSSDTEITDLGGVETRAVNVLKQFTIGMLVLVACVGSFITWKITSDHERTYFDSAFDEHASRFLERLAVTTETKISTVSSLSLAITASSEGLWPNVTIRNFHQLCAISLHVTQASRIAFSPIVSDRNNWEAYAMTETNSTFHNTTMREGNRTFAENIFQEDSQFNALDDLSGGGYAPVWQVSPKSGDESLFMYNLFDGGSFQRSLEEMLQTKGVTMSEVMIHDDVPRAFFFVPIFDNFTSDNVVGVITLEIDWRVYLQDSLPKYQESISIVISDQVGRIQTFETLNDEMHFVGEGDWHDIEFDSMRRKSDGEGDGRPCFCCKSQSNSTFDFAAKSIFALDEGHSAMYEYIINGTKPTCFLTIEMYPTARFASDYSTPKPLGYTLFVTIIFVVTSSLFLFYDCFVQRRQVKVMRAAVQAKSIVNSLYPQQVRDRVFRSAQPKGMEIAISSHSKKQHLKRILLDGTAPKRGLSGEPIADLFPHTTVMFADISGFTAWSSEREPTQVFTLLENVYQKFDMIANRLGVFKVETIGDCYVAVTGLPEKNKHHAVIMAKFAMECLMAMKELLNEMEVILGPGTTDLSMRFGLHSGPVTAGVLRGEKSRFQLFGDTMNTASRMESTSEPGFIQVSQATANLIEEGKKEHWLIARKGMVSIKGKGKMQTFWLNVNKDKSESADVSIEKKKEISIAPSRSFRVWGHLDIDITVSSRISHSEKEDRLIDWNVEVVLGCLANLVARRFEAQGRKRWTRPKPQEDSHDIFEEVTEIIVLPEFDTKAAQRNGDCNLVLPDIVKAQLRLFVATIASFHRSDNQFHNFEHASHVLLSATKLMKRIVSPHDFEKCKITDKHEKSKYVEELHNCTFGISSDPLAQFAIVFSALIHDVEHPGVPNNILVNENAEIASRFKNKSVAEQNSVAVAWDLLMEERFADLQGCIFSDTHERRRFRQLVVNSVMATDIMDRNLNTLRKSRWDKAFFNSPDQSNNVNMNRRATAVLEHIIQASDVAHTMQHWHIFARWNQRLFFEMYTAYLSGRSEIDPSIGWYEGELGFFDHYIIPLAKKLKESGVFGVSSDEYLQYALENRREWQMKGQEIVESMLGMFRQQHKG